jgi:hypothetical protein
VDFSTSPSHKRHPRHLLQAPAGALGFVLAVGFEAPLGTGGAGLDGDVLAMISTEIRLFHGISPAKIR